jgi:hypothetical protein
VSHECIEKEFLLELKKFQSGESVTFYHGLLKRNIIVYLELLVSLQDQLERRSANSIMLGGITYTARCGYSLNFAAVASKIPSCQSCFRGLLMDSSSSSNNTCMECTNWVAHDQNNILMWYNPPQNYPGIEEQLGPLHITYGTLIKAVSTSQTKLRNGTWDKIAARSYLRVHGLNKDAIDRICRGDWEHPASWARGTLLHQHIDVPMHLIFLGVLHTCVQMVHEYMTKTHKSASFIRYTKDTLESIQKLGLSWCKCIAYKSGNFGGWVSENYLAIGRLLPWFYGSIDHIAEDLQCEAPSAPQKQWTKQQNFAWLSIRGLNTKGSAKELRLRVQHYLQAEGGPPPLAPLEGGPVRGVVEMLFSLHCLVCNLVSWNISTLHILNVERGIKIFLTSFDLIRQ